MSDSPLHILIVVLLIAINGFFAAAEVALVSVRQSRLRQMAESGHAGAQAALNLLSNPSRLLSVTQVGVTLASLGLGWAGEDTLYRILVATFQPIVTPATAAWLHALSLIVSFLSISYFHVVFGEVVPKNLAISKADRLAALVAPVLLAFYRLTLPFVVVVEHSAAALSRTFQAKGAHSGGHSAEELKLIVSSSRGLGYLPELQEDLIHRALDLDTIAVREIMVPRNDIVSIDSDASIDDVLATMIREKHSRLPVYDEHTPGKIIGILHYKDLLPVWQERRRAIRSGRPSRAFRIVHLMRPVFVVPETKAVSQMLQEFRAGRSHMALVVDEFGTISGMITVEDVLEQIVGRIEDEHDEKTAPAPHETGPVELDGATRIRDLETEFGIELPSDAGFETLAGFLLFQLGVIPHAGDTTEFSGRRFTVTEMDRNRIARVRIEKLPDAGGPAPDEAAGEERPHLLR